jgi:uncharacterized membrane protein
MSVTYLLSVAISGLSFGVGAYFVTSKLLYAFLFMGVSLAALLYAKRLEEGLIE